ncbi:MAG: N-acetylmuramic acid 6-phosphate etherase [Anaerolineaceae bacterium]|nr:N-acetylmuramic acid 6-phosphate etherase [Anaerolineaceae bacterium]
MLTEQRNPRTYEIDRLDTLEVLQVINDEDKTVALKVELVLPQIAQAVDAIAGRLAAGGRLIYIGAGTSGRLGILDAVECVPTYSTSPEMVQGIIAGGAPAVTRSVEGAEDDEALAIADLKQVNLTPQDAVVGIAASGHTPYVLAAVRYANEIGAFTAGVACNVPAPLLDVAQIGIGVPVGPEVITGSTRMKSGTAQKMVLNMLSTATMVRLGKVYGNLMVDMQMTNSKLVRRARGIVMQVTGVDETRADELLQQAGGKAKLAIAIHATGASAEEAQRRLDAAQGRLRDVIES